jgi:hypothetical protein
VCGTYNYVRRNSLIFNGQRSVFFVEGRGRGRGRERVMLLILPKIEPIYGVEIPDTELLTKVHVFEY